MKLRPRFQPLRRHALFLFLPPRPHQPGNLFFLPYRFAAYFSPLTNVSSWVVFCICQRSVWGLFWSWLISHFSTYGDATKTAAMRTV